MHEDHFVKADFLKIETEANYIYYLLGREEIVYIGVTRNIHQRIAAHIASDKEFEDVMFRKLPDDCDPLVAEFFQIVTYQPKYNSTMISSKVGYMPLRRYRCESMGSPNLVKLKKAIGRHYKGTAPTIHGISFYTAEEVSECLRKLDAETSV